jgi:siroheme synthase-like protein
MMLDVSDRLVVVIGGGAVAARKCDGLLAAGATRIRVVSLEFSDKLPAAVERVTAAFRAAHLDGAGLVFAATDRPAVNDAVVVEARRRGVLVCRADGSELLEGDFSTPAVYREGAVTAAVSAAGSPVIAGKLRDKLARCLDRDLVMMADAMQEIRPMILQHRGMTEAQRRELFRRLATAESLEILKSGGLEGLKASVAEYVLSQT